MGTNDPIGTQVVDSIFRIPNIAEPIAAETIGRRRVMYMHRMRCGEIWSGISNQDNDVCSAGITVSLFAGACDGGKGGDIYYLSVCQSDMLTRIAIADVLGHGSAVSETSAWLHSALESRMNDTAGNEILAYLNRLTCERGLKAITTAAIVGYYTADLHAYFSYAGHHAMLVRRRAGGQWTEATIDDGAGEQANLPLGVNPDVMFTQGRFPLTAGDRIFLYTDGVIEAPGKSSEQFGIDRLMSVLTESGNGTLLETKNAVLDAVRTHTGGPLTHDDVTLLAAEVN